MQQMPEMLVLDERVLHVSLRVATEGLTVNKVSTDSFVLSGATALVAWTWP
jgi:hypothetical protein